MDKSDIVVLLVALITSAATIATNRASNRSSSKSEEDKNDTNLARTESKSRVDMERDAYIRAQQFYEDIITRQDEEIKNLRGEVETLRAEVDSMRGELSQRPKGPPDDRNGP